jgi:hypothetical protein
MFSPADLIIKNLDVYSKPEMADKLTALEDFLTNIISIVAIDAGSQKTILDIKNAIGEVLKMEKAIAKILTDNGYRETDAAKQPKITKKKYNDLMTLVTSVCQKLHGNFKEVFR